MPSEAKACPTCPCYGKFRYCRPSGTACLCHRQWRHDFNKGDILLPLAASPACLNTFHDAPPQPAPSRDAKITDEWCAIAGKEDVVRLDRIHTFAQKMIALGYMDGLKARTRIRKATEGVQPAQSDCGPGPNDRCRTVRCWNHREVQPAPAGFSTFEEAIGRLKTIMSAAIYMTAEQRQVPDGMFIEIRAAHAREVEGAIDVFRARCHEFHQRAVAESRAAGKREVARRVQNWIDGRTVGYPHGDLKDLRDWVQQWIGEETKG